MKKFLALITCLIMLCVGTIQAKESKVSEQPKKIELEYIDVGKVQQVDVMQFNHFPDVTKMIYTDRQYIDYRIPDSRQTITNIYTVAQSDGQSDNSYILQKDALCSPYRLIPDCPEEIISRIRIKYTTHYAYSFCNPYNQPPSKE
jgi:hypothetical protein